MAKATEAEFLHARARLHQFFEMESSHEKVGTNPILREDRIVRLIERLYEEESLDRHFHVRPIHLEGRSFDAFTKKTGLNFDVALLVLSVDLNERHFPLVWRVYVEWMHKRAEEIVVLRMIPEY